MLHQQAAEELGGGLLGGAGEEGLGEVLGERGGYEMGYVNQVLHRCSPPSASAWRFKALLLWHWHQYPLPSALQQQKSQRLKAPRQQTLA